MTASAHEQNSIRTTYDVTIDLSGNPLTCRCVDYVIKTIAWLHKHIKKHHGFVEFSCYEFHELVASRLRFNKMIPEVVGVQGDISGYYEFQMYEYYYVMS